MRDQDGGRGKGTSAATCAANPITRATRMLRNSEDDYSIALEAIEQRKGKILENDATHIRGRRRAGKQKRGSPCGSLFDSTLKQSGNQD